jgi:hypothetical protein
MNFGRNFKKGTYVMAIIQGIIIGIAAVAVVGFIIVGANEKLGSEPKKTEIPTTGPAASKDEKPVDSQFVPLKLFARQHGVFSSAESAATFQAADPSLASAAIIQGDGDSKGKYYIWSSLGLSDAEIMDGDSEETFRKEVTAHVGSCQAVGAKLLRDSLVADTVAKIKVLETENEGEKVSVFNEQLTAITAFTDDIRVVRLHLLAHYASKQDCLKIDF